MILVGEKLGRRYVGEKDKKERMWTEITKDLVTEDAIKHLGYDFEETEFFYYIMSYLKYVRLSLFSFPLSAVLIPPSLLFLYWPISGRSLTKFVFGLQEDVLHLVEVSEDLKRDRRERIREIEWEQRHAPPPKPRLALEGGRPWDEERIIEREIVYEGPPSRRYR